MTLTRGNIKKQIRRLIGPGETRTERGMRTQYFDVGEVSRVKDALEQAATLVNEDHDGDTSVFDYETFDGKEFRLLHNSRVAYIDHSYMDESTHNQALKYLDQLAESLEQLSDTFFPDEEIEDEDEEI